MDYDIIDQLFIEHKKHLDDIEYIQNLFKTARETLKDKALQILKEKIEDICYELKVHFKEEEEGLFPFLYEKTKDKDGLIKSLIAEHRKMEDLCQETLSQIGKIEKGVNKWTELRNSINELLHHLNDHILKENLHLLKLAAEYLDKKTLVEGYKIAEKIREEFGVD